MSILLFLNRLAVMKTNAELDGDMSGDQAVSELSDLIEEARILVKSSGDPAVDADGLGLIYGLKELIDTAMTHHIYSLADGEKPADDCSFLLGRDAAETYLALRNWKPH